MRFTTVILLAGFMQVCAKGTAQKISLNETRSSITKVFDAIKNQSGYVFFYSDGDIRIASPVTIHADSISLTEALEKCFKNQPLTYIIVSKTIVVKEKPSTGDESFSVVMTNNAPAHEIGGKVLNQEGQPVPGITVTIKGSGQTTVTDEKGEFALSNVTENTVLVFTAVNVEKMETTVGERSNITLTLQIKRSLLDDIQIIGYGSTTKRLNTGSMGSVTSAEIDNQPVVNPLMALEGRVAGLQMTVSSGAFGAPIDVQIRGLNSNFAATSHPLYIIDGVAYPYGIENLAPNNGSLNTSTSNPMNNINPDDIQSVSILKDADATAVYGSRGANGVILIVTKKGAAGVTKLDFDVATGWSKAARLMPKLLNTPDYLAMRKQAFVNDGIEPDESNAPDLTIWSQTANQNWQKEIIGNTGSFTNAQASLSGGDDRVRYLLSGAYNYQKGITWGDNYDKRANLHLNVENNSRDKRFNMSTNITYSNDHIMLNGAGSYISFFLPPNMPSYNPDGSIYYLPGSDELVNPLFAKNAYQENKTSNLLLNTVLSYMILPNLKLSLNTGYNQLNNIYFNATPSTARNPSTSYGINSFAALQNTTYSTLMGEPQLDYNTKIGDGKLQLMLGGTWQQNQSAFDFIRGQNYSSDALIQNIGAASQITDKKSGTTLYKFESVFFRANYNWQDKYIVNGSFRRDGSSRFAENYRFANFWSAGAAWIFSNESFLKDNRVLSFGKIRGSYGLTGNDQIGDYQYMDFYATGPVYNGVGGLYSSQVANDYRWEETYKGDIGLELGFIKSRILLTVDYYNNKSQNLLTIIPLASQAGYGQYTGNLPAVVQNKGWEFSLNTTNIKTKNFSWITSFNLTFPKNILLAFPGLAESSYASNYEIGKSIQMQKGFKYAGVDPATGWPLFNTPSGKVVDGNDIDYRADQQYIGELNPRSFGGLGNIFTYKSFELNIFFQFSNSSTNTSVLTSMPVSVGGLGNTVQPLTIGNWTEGNHDASLPALTTSIFGMPGYFAYTGSNVGFVDNSYIRLKTLSLTWSMPSKYSGSIKLSNVKIFVQAQNLLTFTNYNGIDPESLMSVPVLKTVTFGIKASL